MNLYLLPGMGGDVRLFNNFNLEGMNKIVLEWKVPQNARTMAEYAREMAEDIDTSQPFMLAGCSMGGMVAVEMSKFLKPEKLVLVSSAKTRSELPPLVRMWRYFPFYHLVPAGWLLKMSGLMASRVGLKDEAGHALFKDMLRVVGKTYLKKAMHFVVNWQNTEPPTNYFHVHGNADKVLPYKHVKEDLCIEGGTHFMVLTRGEVMSKLLSDHLGLNPARGIKATSNSHGQSLPVT